MKQKVSAQIVSHETLSPGIFSLVLKTELAKGAKPGQFVGVYLNDPGKILMRPISICDVDEEQMHLRLVYRAAGEGTKELSSYPIGSSVEVLGVLGNGYDIEKMKGRRVILLGGGIGIPPMLYLAKKLSEQADADMAVQEAASGPMGTWRSPVVAVLGYADKHTFLKREFDGICPTYVASMDGSVGTKGTVIDALQQGMLMGDMVCACGPMPMLKAVKEYAGDFGMRAFLSLEERMACGVGACLGCVTKTRDVDAHTHVNNARVCVEGPVFAAEEVIL